MDLIYLEPHHRLIFKAKWVIPILEAPILDGALEVVNQTITRVGPFKEVYKEAYKSKVIDFGEAIILPCLVNLHTHLELSCLRYKIRSSGSFISWVRNVIKVREKLSLLEMKEYAHLALREVWEQGVGVIGDITNTGITVNLLYDSYFRGYIFQEIINFKGGTKLKSLEEGTKAKNFRYTYSAHSPYTVSPLLLQAIKSYNRRKNLLFCIHCGESQEEVDFLRTGKGEIRELLKERGQWNESFVAPGLSPVKYLESLGVLDEKTLLVHMVYLEEGDIEILRKRKVKICVCPRSNLYIGVGLPKLKTLLEAGLEVGIGTDSLASNESLSIWEELKVLYFYYPEVSPYELLKLATFNGARILGYFNLGAILPGYSPNLMVVELYDYISDDEKEMLISLINAKKEVRYRIYGSN